MGFNLLRSLRRAFADAVLDYMGRERLYVLKRKTPVPVEGECDGWRNPQSLGKYDAYHIAHASADGMEIYLRCRSSKRDVENLLMVHGITDWSVQPCKRRALDAAQTLKIS